MSDKKNAATVEGVEQAWGFYLYDHPITVPGLIQEAIKKAFENWLDANADKIVAAIADRHAR